MRWFPHPDFEPPPGCDGDIAGYEALGWGTNWIYLLVPRDDLARGDLRRVVVTGASSQR